MFRLLMSRGTSISIQLNGREQDVDRGTRLADLLSGLSLPANGYAVELNARLVRHDEAPAIELSDGDRVEVVTLVGGG